MAPMMATIVLVSLAVSILVIAAAWRVFTKAGQPGWASIIPFYNVIVLLRTTGRPGWWLLLMFIPVANLVVSIIVSIDLAKSFGKGVGFGIVTFLFPFIGAAVLGFGGAQYVGPAGRPQHQGQPYPADHASTVRYQAR